MEQERKELSKEDAAAQVKAVQQNRRDTPPPVKAPKLEDGSKSDNKDPKKNPPPDA